MEYSNEWESTRKNERQDTAKIVSKYFVHFARRKYTYLASNNMEMCDAESSWHFCHRSVFTLCTESVVVVVSWEDDANWDKN